MAYTFRMLSLLYLIYSVSHETWQLVNSLECLFPKFILLFNTKDKNKNIILESYYSKINFKLQRKIYLSKRFFKQNKLQTTFNI